MATWQASYRQNLDHVISALHILSHHMHHIVPSQTFVLPHSYDMNSYMKWSYKFIINMYSYVNSYPWIHIHMNFYITYEFIYETITWINSLYESTYEINIWINKGGIINSCICILCIDSKCLCKFITIWAKVCEFMYKIWINNLIS